MPLLKEVVPQEFHEKPYLKDLLDKEQSPETFSAVFKKLDGAETLIGKRPGVPAKDAKDEEWDKFLANIRPEKTDDYEIPLEKDAKPDEAFLKVIKESFHAGDISKRQAQKFLAKFQPELKKYAEGKALANKEAQAQSDADFETLVKAAFGEENKAVLARARAQIAEHAPAAVKAHIDKLDNNSLAILTGVIEGILKKYASEDDLNPGGDPEGDDGTNLREQAKKLMQSDAYKDAFHADHEKTVAKVRQMYKEVDAASKK